MAGHWEVSETGELRLRAGRTIRVDAATIYSVEFDGISEVDGISVRRPSADVIGLMVVPMLKAPSLVAAVDGAAVRTRLRIEPYGDVEQWPSEDHCVVGRTWIPLDRSALSAAESALRRANVGLGEPLSASQLLQLAWDTDATLILEGDIGEFRTAFAGRLVTVPVQASLYPYQHDAVAYLLALVNAGLGALLADEMGLGKTLQAIAVLALRCEESHRPNLIVAPASLIANWIRELGKFAPQLSVLAHGGFGRTGNYRVLAAHDVTVVSYETLVRDAAMFNMVNWALVVADEAQFVKNSATSRSRALRALPRVGALALTGTPIENSLADAWALLEFLVPDYLGDFDRFALRFPDSIAAARELSVLVAPLVIRRRVAEVADDLNDRIDVFRPVELPGSLIPSYESARASSGNGLATLMQLRKICAHAPTLGDGGHGQDGKLEQLAIIAETAGAQGDKLIVFASFTATIDLLHDELIRTLGSDAYVATVDGRGAVSERQAIIDEFTAWVGPAALVLNPRAAGVGLNIQAANYVVHFNPEWNPAVIAQASARAHRRGQKKTVFVYYLYYESTVEEVMLDRLGDKAALADAAAESFTDSPKPTELTRALGLSPLH